MWYSITMVIQNLPISIIQAGDNDRTTFAAARLSSLAQSMKDNGLAQPITVRPLGDDRYEIVAGERRYRAALELGWETIPALVRDMTDKEASAVMLTENVSREDLNPIEEARAYSKRLQSGWMVSEISQATGISAQRIERRISLLRLQSDIADLVASGHFPIGHAEMLTGLDASRQLIALRIFNASGKTITRRNFASLVGKLEQEQSQDSLFSLESYATTVAQDMASRHLRGRGAVINVPTRDDLPIVSMESGRDTCGDVIFHFIEKLKWAGLDAEASTVGTLLQSLIYLNYVSFPKTEFAS